MSKNASQGNFLLFEPGVWLWMEGFSGSKKPSLKCKYTDSSKVRVGTLLFYKRGRPQRRGDWCGLGERCGVHGRSFRGVAGLQKRGPEDWVEKTPKHCFKVLCRVGHENNSREVLWLCLIRSINISQPFILVTLLSAEGSDVPNHPSLSHQDSGSLGSRGWTNNRIKYIYTLSWKFDILCCHPSTFL